MRTSTTIFYCIEILNKKKLFSFKISHKKFVNKKLFPLFMFEFAFVGQSQRELENLMEIIDEFA